MGKSHLAVGPSGESAMDLKIQPVSKHCPQRRLPSWLSGRVCLPMQDLLDFTAPNFIKHVYFSKQYFRLVFIWDQMYIFIPKPQCNIF